LQHDGKIILIGEFSVPLNLMKRKIIRLNPDGSIDTLFDAQANPNGEVLTLAVQTDGKMVLGGHFTSYDGKMTNRIARINEDGTLDTTFVTGTGCNYMVRSLAIQPDGKILVGGNFTQYNGALSRRIVRIHPDGTKDSTFLSETGLNSIVYDIIVQSNGKILICGDFFVYNGLSRRHIACLNADGTIDPLFQPGSGLTGMLSCVYTMSLQTDGKLFIGGLFSEYNGISKSNIARANIDGTMDSTYNIGTGSSGNVFSIVVQQSDQKIIIGGDFKKYNNSPINRLARLHVNGELDSTFQVGDGCNGSVYGIVIQPDEKILVFGDFTLFNGQNVGRIVRLNIDGSLDNGFYLSEVNEEIYAAALQSDGKIIIGGSFYSCNGTQRTSVARLNHDGTLDIAFNPYLEFGSSERSVMSVTIQDDDKIILGGAFNMVENISRNRIARLNADGTLDVTFDPGIGFNVSSSCVYTSAVLPDGKILVGGRFNHINGSVRNCIARLNADGSLDMPFYPGSSANNSVHTIVLLPDGKIMIGGMFTTYNGKSRNRIARLHPNGTPDLSFKPGQAANCFISAIALYPDDRCLIGGCFTSFGSVGRNRIARINNCVVDPSVVLAGNTITANASGAIYQWIDCENGNEPIWGETSQVFTPAQFGSYAVIVTQNGCTDTSSCISVNDNFIFDAFAKKIHVFPNPVTDEVSIEVEEKNEIMSFEIINTNGQIVYSGELLSRIVVRVNQLSPGMYVVKVQYRDSYAFKKFLKE
jgi:uncharacterized delta-60 repeat protein